MFFLQGGPYCSMVYHRISSFCILLYPDRSLSSVSPSQVLVLRSSFEFVSGMVDVSTIRVVKCSWNDDQTTLTAQNNPLPFYHYEKLRAQHSSSLFHCASRIIIILIKHRQEARAYRGDYTCNYVHYEYHIFIYQFAIHHCFHRWFDKLIGSFYCTRFKIKLHIQDD